jgi:hypothetical protein
MNCQFEIDNKWNSITKLECNNEFKNLILRCMAESDFVIKFSDSSNYSYYWVLLENYMKQNYNCNPDKSDKFIFLLLLTYPKKYISNLNSFLQLKIAFNELIDHGSSENSDFTCCGYYFGDSNNCICSQPIENVYQFTNILSGIIFNVGSVCNNRYRIISENDENYQLMKKAQRYRQQEKKDGLPEGYLELQRLNKKNKKNAKNKNQSITNSSTLNSINDKSYITNSKCFMCTNKKIFCQSSKGVFGICSCVPIQFKMKYKSVLKCLQNKIKTFICLNCNLETRKINDSKLCFICDKYNKIINCKKCFNDSIVSINSENIFCDNCISTIKKCIDCDKFIMYDESYRTRCSDCFKFKKQNQEMINKTCENCNSDYEIPIEDQEWRKTCSDCYKKTKCHCENCNLQVTIYTVKKDGPKKGKEFYNCKNCNLFKWIL